MSKVTEIKDYNSEWMKGFRKDIRKYNKEPDEEKYKRLCYDLYTALVYNEAVPFSAWIEIGKNGDPVVKFEVVEKVKSKKKYFVLATTRDSNYKMVATTKIALVFSILKEHEEIDGIVVDPHTNSIVFSREELMNIIGFFLEDCHEQCYEVFQDLAVCFTPAMAWKFTEETEESGDTGRLRLYIDADDVSEMPLNVAAKKSEFLRNIPQGGRETEVALMIIGTGEELMVLKPGEECEKIIPTGTFRPGPIDENFKQDNTAIICAEVLEIISDPKESRYVIGFACALGIEFMFLVPLTCKKIEEGDLIFGVFDCVALAVKDGREPNELKIETKRPCSHETLTEIKEMILKLCPGETDDFVIVGFEDVDTDEGLLFIQTKKTGENEYHVELGYSMVDFGWERPLILARDNCTESETLMLFKQICYEGKNTDNIALVQNEFKNIGDY